MGCGSSTEAHDPSSTGRPYPTGNNQYPQQQPQYHQQPAPQQQKAPTAPQDEKTDIERQRKGNSTVKHVTIDKHVLERYVELENQTRVLENKNVVKNCKVKEEQITDLKNTIQELEEHYQECVKQTAKEKADVDQLQTPSVQEFFKNQGDYDAKMSKEQEEYLEALNNQEIAEKDLEGVRRQRDQLTQEVQGMKGEADKLQTIYKEQDELLAGIFDGKYGSELEFKLESELDMMLDRKQRISVAKYKWQNARVLLQHAVNQLAFAVRRWTELGQVKPENLQQRYTVATEARNNLVAASQNIASAQRYLHTIQFPYCKPEEVVTLNRATSNIYTDMQSTDRHAHALQCYSITHRRAAALLQWFDHVIKNTIEKDLEKGVGDVNGKTKKKKVPTATLR